MLLIIVGSRAGSDYDGERNSHAALEYQEMMRHQDLVSMPRDIALEMTTNGVATRDFENNLASIMRQARTLEKPPTLSDDFVEFLPGIQKKLQDLTAERDELVANRGNDMKARASYHPRHRF
jgi:hypothetical protein